MKAFLGSVALLAVLIAFLLWETDPRPAATGPLSVYCAAGIREPVEAAARAYEKAYDAKIQLQYGPSQTLLAGAEISRTGDLYIPADEDYIKLAREKGLIDEAIPLARLKPVLAVLKGNPKRIGSAEDLLRADVKIGLANPETAAVGRITREAFAKSGRWEALRERTAVFKMTVNDVANDVKLGTIDAGVVWDAIVKRDAKLESVALPELADAEGEIGVAVLRSSAQPAAALRFARFLAARDRGLAEFERFAYRPVPGDAWSEAPELRLFAGAMLRPAIEKTIDAFEEREGVRVTRIYNGCGILVAQMKAGERPDLYFACDESFMADVKDLFLPSRPVSINQLVILVPKGNPRAIRALKDLGKPGLRVGVGHEKQCALGVITKETLIQSGVYAQVAANVKVQTPTGDMLVNQMRTGSLDAVVAYVSNATSAKGELEAVAIDIPCAMAVQPVAVGRASTQGRLASRLVEALRGRGSRERFETEGFRWKAGSE